MKAINPKFQSALDKFMENDFWRKVYEGAPAGAKAKLETEFQCSANIGDGPIREETNRIWREDVKPTLKAEDWKYLAQFARRPQQKEFYLQMAASAK